MCKWNDCEKCPYFSAWIPYYSEDGCPVENCEAGLNPEEGCKHNRLVRWILFKIQQRKLAKYEAYLTKFIEKYEEE